MFSSGDGFLVNLHNIDREEATKEEDFTLNEDDDDQDDEQEEWDRDVAWANDGDDGEGDVKDESAAYLEFLEEEVGALHPIAQYVFTS